MIAHRNFLTTIFLLSGLIVLQGCANTITVKQDTLPVFQERSGQFSEAAGLLLSAEARNHVISSRVFGGSLTFQVGEALESSATASLERAFRTVTVIEGAAPPNTGIRRKISIDVDTASKFIPGATTLSNHTASMVLNYAVYDENQTLLCKGKATGSVTRTAGGAAFVPGIFGVAAFHSALGKIVNEGLAAALENMNNQLMDVCREAILTGIVSSPVIAAPHPNSTPLGELVFSEVAEKLNVTHCAKQDIISYWNGIAGKRVTWTGQVHSTRRKGETVQVFCIDRSAPTSRPYNIVLMLQGQEASAATGINAGRKLTFTGTLSKYRMGKGNASAIVYLSEVELGQDHSDDAGMAVHGEEPSSAEAVSGEENEERK